MKKNSLKAFEAKAVKVENITGGGYFDGTYKNNVRVDSQYVTQKGERNQVGENATYDQYDGDLCTY